MSTSKKRKSESDSGEEYERDVKPGGKSGKNEGGARGKKAKVGAQKVVTVEVKVKGKKAKVEESVNDKDDEGDTDEEEGDEEEDTRDAEEAGRGKEKHDETEDENEEDDGEGEEVDEGEVTQSQGLTYPREPSQSSPASQGSVTQTKSEIPADGKHHTSSERCSSETHQ